MEKKLTVEDLEMTPSEARQGNGGPPLSALCRSFSLRAPDPSAQLAAAYRNKDIETFGELLSGSPPEVDPNHWYDDPHFATMLDLASRDAGRDEYVRVLLQAGADPNRVNRVRKKAPLHLAAEAGNVASLEALLQAKALDVNKQDNAGCTALHHAAKEDAAQSGKAREELEHRYRRCVQLLMQHPNVNINKPNRKGHTAVHLAAIHASPAMVRLMLSAGGSRLDVDSFEDATGETARQLVAAKYPELARMLPPRQDPDGAPPPLTADRLFFHLYSRESGPFLEALAEGGGGEVRVGLLDENDGSHTLLQLASEAGLHDVVTALVDNGANPNLTLAANPHAPLHAACLHGYYRVARTLLACDRTDLHARAQGDTALHAAVKGLTEYDGRTLGASRAGRDHTKCVQVLLAKGVDANAADRKGNTALHYAARNGDAQVVAALLRAGAYIGVRNRFGEPALADVSPRALEAYLDECVVTNDLLPREDNYEVVFKYSFLAGAHAAPASKQVSVSVDDDAKRLMGGRGDAAPLATETDPLLYMSKSADLRHLLKHPIITSFLYLKWQRIRAFFYINLAFYVAFWLLLTAYVLTGYSERPDQGLIPDAASSAPAGQGTAQRNASAKGVPDNDDVAAAASAAPALAALLALFLLLLAVRELFQLVVSPHRYVLSLENWMEALLIVVTAVLLLSRQTDSYSRQQLSAVAILLSWAELVLLIGRHPLLATNIEMFKTVSLNFLKFLAWYSILIVAFALSFYTLFRGKADDGEDNEFLSPGRSVFKSIVMLTGEFDAGSIPFPAFPVTSHVLFVLFVFLIAIVLFNLLNGLAVSDTQAIREDAELVAYVSRVKLVAYVESMLVGEVQGGAGAGGGSGLARWLRAALCGCVNACHAGRPCVQTLSARVNLFPDVVPDQQIHVLPNQGNRIEFSTRLACARNRTLAMDEDDLRSCAAHCRQVSMDPAIMKDVKQLFLRRSADAEASASASAAERMAEHYQKEIRTYVQRIEHLEQAQRDLLQLLKGKQ